MDFSEALYYLKDGQLVAREGWNGKNMFIFLVRGSTFNVSRKPLLGIFPEGTEINYCPHIDMKTADGSIVPWSASQTDIMAEDWDVVASVPERKAFHVDVDTQDSEDELEDDFLNDIITKFRNDIVDTYRTKEAEEPKEMFYGALHLSNQDMLDVAGTISLITNEFTDVDSLQPEIDSDGRIGGVVTGVHPDFIESAEHYALVDGVIFPIQDNREGEYNGR